MVDASVEQAPSGSSTRRLILASSSPRRQSLLKEAGYRFDVVPAEIDEEAYPSGLLPSAVAEFLAHKKASVVADRFPDAVVLGADTVVAFGDQLLGKARDVDEARRILELLSGTTHLVITGVAVICRATGFDRKTRSMSAVRMRQMSAEAINRYLATGDWIGKAGAYGIQDSDPFVVRLTGSHTNIVGLPMGVTKTLLTEAGIPPPHPSLEPEASPADRP
ncbi:MAG: Maf family protein [Tepidisphaerales bacterium]